MKKIHPFILSLAFLFGCANAPVSQSPSQLAATHGYVYVSIPKESAIDYVQLESLKENSTFLLQPHPGFDSNGAGLWVPAGEYRLAKWQNYKLNDYPKIEVQQGRITDLGGLIQLPIGGYRFVVLPVKHREFDENLKSIQNEYQSVLVSKDPIEWEVQKAPASIETLYPLTGLGLLADLLMDYERHVNMPAISKQLADAKTVNDFLLLWKTAAPPLTRKFEHDASGNLYYGADMGQIRVRGPQGGWRALDTGSLHEVTAVKADGKALVAGFDNGVIRVTEDGGVSWKTLAAMGGDARIVDIDRKANQWFVAVARGVVNGAVWKEVNNIEVYQSGSNNLRDLVKIKQIGGEKGFKAINVFPGQVESTDDFYYVGTPSQLLRMNLSTKAWAPVTPPTDMTGFHASSASGVLTAYHAQGAFSKLYLSSDNGESWVKYNTPPYVFSDIRFDNLSDGRAVRWNMGAFSSDLELREFDRQGGSWKTLTEAPHGCRRMLPDTTGMPRFCITAAGSILSYTDSKWSVEYAAD
ncbi:hypothetical protein BCO9919_02022 [Burkholderia cenocepacia]|uniref:Uncharacterized protein n=1 Tax=Burkholderia cenocepacia TaxID=95486 RepID=A0A6J5J2N8_9BURK|nr:MULTISPECIES: hypothetical protein [Burkholderia]CAB3965889.1 hypothetical protein BCO9919_02022 [Burkholderia cenocepacia]